MRSVSSPGATRMACGVNRPTENVVIKIAGSVRGGTGGHRQRDFGRHPQCKGVELPGRRGCEEIVRFKTKVGRGGVVEDILAKTSRPPARRGIQF